LDSTLVREHFVKEAAVSKKLKGYQRMFVKPWPEDRACLSRSGKVPSRDWFDWLEGYCVRCGRAGHQAKDCFIYPGRRVGTSHARDAAKEYIRYVKSRRRDFVIQDVMMEKF
jgi:hypothetical protein